MSELVDRKEEPVDRKEEPVDQKDEQEPVPAYEEHARGDPSPAIDSNGIVSALQLCDGVESAACIIVNGNIHCFVTPETCEISTIKTQMGSLQPYHSLRIIVTAMKSLPRLKEGADIDEAALEAHVRQQEEVVEKEVRLSRLSVPPVIHVREISTSSSCGSSFNSPESCSSSMMIVNRSQQEGGSWEGYLESQLPQKRYPHYLRSFRHIAFIVYRRLFAVIFAINIVPFAFLIFKGASVSTLATATSVNLAAAILIRQDNIVNFFFILAGCIPRSFPLSIRKNCAKVYHLGGIHSGCATSATFWFGYLMLQATIDAFQPHPQDSTRRVVSTTTLAVTYSIMVLLIGMLTFAYPSLRQKFHNKFEQIHRFSGWSCLILFWLQTIFLTRDLTPPGGSFGSALLQSPSFWCLIAITLSIISPWLHLRKVKVRAVKLSDHAVRLYFDYAHPVPGSFARLSDRPLFEWHSFATIAAPGRSGFSMVVSNAGDWTSKYIQNPPTEMWVRGVPVRGVMNVSHFFNRIVIVATGSGIGPCLPVLMAAKQNKIQVRVLWSTRRPRETFGNEIVDNVLDADPRAIIYDTKVHGKPDMVKLTYKLYQESNAEAVVVISNPPLTKKVVYGMECRGVSCYGAIWDS